MNEGVIVRPCCFGEWSKCADRGADCPHEPACYQDECERDDACSGDYDYE